MAKCGACGTTILLGGKKAGGVRFCNDRCASRGMLVQAAQRVPADQVKVVVLEVHRGLCPVCGGSGPVDVHVSHWVWSLLLMTSWRSTPRISCRSCGVKKQALAFLSSSFFGWWGFPWGFVITPVQMLRNLGGMLSPPKASQPSDALAAQVRFHLAAQALSGEQGDAAVAAKPPSFLDYKPS